MVSVRFFILKNRLIYAFLPENTEKFKKNAKKIKKRFAKCIGLVYIRCCSMYDMRDYQGSGVSGIKKDARVAELADAYG